MQISFLTFWCDWLGITQTRFRFMRLDKLWLHLRIRCDMSFSCHSPKSFPTPRSSSVLWRFHSSWHVEWFCWLFGVCFWVLRLCLLPYLLTFLHAWQKQRPKNQANNFLAATGIATAAPMANDSPFWPRCFLWSSFVISFARRGELGSQRLMRVAAKNLVGSFL